MVSRTGSCYRERERAISFLKKGDEDYQWKYISIEPFSNRCLAHRRGADVFITQCLSVNSSCCTRGLRQGNITMASPLPLDPSLNTHYFILWHCRQPNCVYTILK